MKYKTPEIEKEYRRLQRLENQLRAYLKDNYRKYDKETKKLSYIQTDTSKILISLIETLEMKRLQLIFEDGYNEHTYSKALLSNRERQYKDYKNVKKAGYTYF